MGIVYVLTNEAMPGLVKIGMTDDAAPSTGMGPLCSAGVPLPFAVAYACRTERHSDQPEQQQPPEHG